MAARDNSANRVLASNRRARYDYEFVKEFQAGIALMGNEIKSLRTGHGQISEAYISVKNGEAWLYNSYIAPYSQQNSVTRYDPYRVRKLLLTRAELTQIARLQERQKLTSIPTQVYLTNSNIAKIRFGVGRYRRQADKRTVLKNKATQAEINSSLRQQNLKN